MAEKNIFGRFIQKHDIEANWQKATNFVPKLGEMIVYDPDDNFDYSRVKIGDGERTVNQLPFIGATDTTMKIENVAADAKAVGEAIADLSNNLASDYNESIIGLSVDGQTITYIKGDGSQHTLVTQDTDTTYSIGTDEAIGLTKLYATTGSAEDGTMTQKAIKTELDKKISVSIDPTQNMLVFTN